VYLADICTLWAPSSFALFQNVAITATSDKLEQFRILLSCMSYMNKTIIKWLLPVPCCPVVSQFEYMPLCQICAASGKLLLSVCPNWLAFAWPIIGKHYFVHRSASLQHITMPPEEDQAMDIGNMHTSTSIKNIWFKFECVVLEICLQTGRQKNRHAHHNTPLDNITRLV